MPRPSVASFVNTAGTRALYSEPVGENTRFVDRRLVNAQTHQYSERRVGPRDIYAPDEIARIYEEFESTFPGGYSCANAVAHRAGRSIPRESRRTVGYGLLGLMTGGPVGAGIALIPFIGPVVGVIVAVGATGTGAYQGRLTARENYASCLAMHAFRTLIQSPAIVLPATVADGISLIRLVPAHLLHPELLPDLDQILDRVNVEFNLILAPIPLPDEAAGIAPLRR